MRGRGSGGIAGNPVLIGAATTLVIIVAVFLAYNANQGLPFVPTYQLKVDVPSGANLVRGNEVRVGGARVGTVDRIEARRRPDGTNFARLVLKLDKAVDPLPRDSKIAIRSKSALGLKYVEITRGESSRGFADGETMPLSASAPNQVEFDEVINTFDDRTRAGIQGSLDGFGTALAGRGAGLNAAIGAFRPLLGNVIPVAQNLSSRSTDLRGLVRGLSRAAAEVGPVAQTQADLFSNLDTTFTALNQVARPYIQDSISEGAPALDAAVRSFKVQQPFLRNTAGLFADLRPGARALRTAAPDLSEALRVGTPTLLRAPALNRRLEPVFTTLQAFAEDPAVPRAIRRLSETARTLRPTLEYLAPAQTTCNYVSLFFRNIASVVSEGDANGTWQRFIIVATPAGPNNEGLASAKPADGPTEANHLHSNPYPNTAAPGQPKECESGNEVYLRGRTTIGNVPGTQSATTEVIP
jgi:virulence factor Mce-like protein